MAGQLVVPELFATFGQARDCQTVNRVQSGGIIKLSRRTNKAKGKVFQPSSRECLVASTALPTRTQYLMISQWPPVVLARRNIHYGWAVVAITFLTALITAGTVGAPGVFIVPLQKEFGWTTAEISSALSIRFILFGLMAPFAAALHNRFGARNVTRLALLVVPSALVLSLEMTKVWQLMLLWGVVVGIGTGMTALVLGATIATRWFSARRGLVIRHSHRKHSHRSVGVSSATRQFDRSFRLEDSSRTDVRDARTGGFGGVHGDARSSRRRRPAALRRYGC